MSGPRVVLGGIALESNAFAPPVGAAEFHECGYFEGAAILAEAAGAATRLPREAQAFIRAMQATGPWQPIPTLITLCQPAGRVEQAFFAECQAAIVEGLRSAGPVDAVYLALHGAMVATGSDDPDGDLLQAVRAVVGPDVPVVATLDLHANVSDRMVDAADVLIAYLTNPHVDMIERGEEAAFTLRRLLAGSRAAAVHIAPPLVPPSIALLTAEGPYADLIDYGQRRQRELAGAILNVSVCGGFAFSDSAKTGLTITVTGRDAPEPAERLARDLAERAWEGRARFRRSLMPLADAVALALRQAAEPQRPAAIFSDAGDNPGGGGGGNTIWLLQALHAAGAKGVLIGAFCDPALARAAHAAGPGGTFDAVFNSAGEIAEARRFAAAARVVALGDGDVVGRLGIHAGRRMLMGPAALLELGGPGGILAAVISNRQQTADPMVFEQFGLDIGAFRTVAVKSRGHFRAGFAPWFAPAQVFEVDTPGLTTPVLERLSWRNLRRPVYPLDPETTWTPVDGQGRLSH